MFGNELAELLDDANLDLVASSLRIESSPSLVIFINWSAFFNILFKVPILAFLYKYDGSSSIGMKLYQVCQFIRQEVGKHGGHKHIPKSATLIELNIQ